MKKFLPLLVLFVFVFPALAYTQSDIDNATFLSNESIIVRQSSVAGYRLDDKITRAEVIGMALKIQGMTLPNDYTCKNYFTDVKHNSTNNWICRAVEIGADNNLVTRANAKFRAQDNITRAEALAIMMTAGSLDTDISSQDDEDKYIQNPAYDLRFRQEFGGAIFDDSNEWQKQLIISAVTFNIVIPKVYFIDEGGELSTRHVSFFPNRPATRAEVFGFAKAIKGGNAETLSSGISDPWELFQKFLFYLENHDMLGANSVSYNQVTPCLPSEQDECDAMFDFMYSVAKDVRQADYVYKWEDSRQIIFSTIPKKLETDTNENLYSIDHLLFLKETGGNLKFLQIAPYKVLFLNDISQSQIDQMFIDSDEDGVGDEHEKCKFLGIDKTPCVKTDPLKRDTDGDGLWDGTENAMN